MLMLQKQRLTYVLKQIRGTDKTNISDSTSATAIEAVCCLQLKGMGEGESKDEQQDDKERKEVAKDNGKKEESEEDDGEECAAYEFSVTETTILEVVMDSMRTCGLAIGLLALSSLMLGKHIPYYACAVYSWTCSNREKLSMSKAKSVH